MLVNIRKLVKHPEGIDSIVLPSLVRLQPLDDCLGVWVDAPDFTLPLPGLHGPVSENRELRSRSDRIGQGVSGVGDSKFVGEIVEGGSEVVQTIADEEAKPNRWLAEDFNPDELLACLRVEFVDNAVRVSFPPSSVFRLQALQVLERPI